MPTETTQPNNLTTFGNLNVANDFDDAAETLTGRQDHDRAHGMSDETTGSIHDHWHTLQHFAGSRHG